MFSTNIWKISSYILWENDLGLYTIDNVAILELQAWLWCLSRPNVVTKWSSVSRVHITLILINSNLTDFDNSNLCWFVQDSTEDEEKHSKPMSSSSSTRERAATAPETAMRGYTNDKPAMTSETAVRGHTNDKPSESGDHSSPSTGGQCYQCGTAFTSVLKRRVSYQLQQVFACPVGGLGVICNSWLGGFTMQCVASGEAKICSASWEKVNILSLITIGFTHVVRYKTIIYWKTTQRRIPHAQ